MFVLVAASAVASATGFVAKTYDITMEVVHKVYGFVEIKEVADLVKTVLTVSFVKSIWDSVFGRKRKVKAKKKKTKKGKVEGKRKMPHLRLPFYFSFIDRVSIMCYNITNDMTNWMY